MDSVHFDPLPFTRVHFIQDKDEVVVIQGLEVIFPFGNGGYALLEEDFVLDNVAYSGWDHRAIVQCSRVRCHGVPD